MDWGILEEDNAIVWTKKVRVTVEEIGTVVSHSQRDVYFQMKALQRQYPPVKVDENIDLSRLADDSNDVIIWYGLSRYGRACQFFGTTKSG